MYPDHFEAFSKGLSEEKKFISEKNFQRTQFLKKNFF
jgi:hypothetical protein